MIDVCDDCSRMYERLNQNPYCKRCGKERTHKMKLAWERNKITSNPKYRAARLEKTKRYFETTRYYDKYYARNRDRILARGRRWASDNPGKRNANRQAYNARKLRAMPPWVDRFALEAIYKRAKAAGMDVDHIVPLKGKNVCGLHVPWNLQLLAPADNYRKGNRLYEELAYV